MGIGIIILIITIIIILLDRIFLLFDKKETPRNKIITVILIFFLILSTLLIYLEDYKSEKYSKDSGKLIGDLKDKKITYPEINCGGTIISFDDSSKDENVLGVPLLIWVEEGKLKVSTTIIDKDNNILVKLEENEWEVKTNTPSYFRRNFDNTALEVIDNEDNVILQIEFIDNSIRLSGVWYNEDGSGTYINCSSDNFIEIGKVDKNSTFDVGIEKLFKYPADNYPGKRR